MGQEDQISQLARSLFEEHRARKRFAPLPPQLAPATVDEAYAVQEALVQLRMSELGEVAGYKVAMTTPVMQQLVGLDEPASGAILSGVIHHSPCTLAAADFVRLGVECEIAVQLGADLLPGQAPFDRAQVLAAIATVMPAFELIEDRNADYALLPGQAISLICDNSWNEGIVLGAPLSDWERIDLASLRGQLFINGEMAGEGKGADVMGHPAEALVWLANAFARQGKSLRAGMVVMTGSIIPTNFPAAGSDLRFVVEGLGDVQLQVV